MGECVCTQTSVLLSDTLRLAIAKKVRTASASLADKRNYTRVLSTKHARAKTVRARGINIYHDVTRAKHHVCGWGGAGRLTMVVL